MSGAGSGPPDHPGYIVINMLDPNALAAAEAQGYRLATDAQPNIIWTTGSVLYGVFSYGYGQPQGQR